VPTLVIGLVVGVSVMGTAPQGVGGCLSVMTTLATLGKTLVSATDGIGEEVVREV